MTSKMSAVDLSCGIKISYHIATLLFMRNNLLSYFLAMPCVVCVQLTSCRLLVDRYSAVDVS